MKKSVKAALLSGLVFPGVGQFSLKRYLRGLVFFVPAMLSLVFIVDSSMRRAFAIAGQIERGRCAARCRCHFQSDTGGACRPGTAHAEYCTMASCCLLDYQYY